MTSDLSAHLTPGAPVRVIHGKPWGRTVTMRGVVERWDGQMLTIQRRFGGGGRYDSLDAPIRSGDHGVIELIAGGWVLRRTYLRASGALIGELYNIQTPVTIEPGLARYIDLEIDVARRGQHVEIVDEAELAAVVARGALPAELGEIARDLAHTLAAIPRAGGDWRAADAPRGRRPPPD